MSTSKVLYNSDIKNPCNTCCGILFLFGLIITLSTNLGPEVGFPVSFGIMGCMYLLTFLETLLEKRKYKKKIGWGKESMKEFSTKIPTYMAPQLFDKAIKYIDSYVSKFNSKKLDGKNIFLPYRSSVLILKAFEEKTIEKIPNLIESMDQWLRNPNLDVLNCVPIQLVERFKEDIEVFKIRYLHLFLKNDFDKIQNLKRLYVSRNLDENFKFKINEILDFEPSFIGEVFDKIINIEISKEEFDAFDDKNYTPSIQIEDGSIYAIFQRYPDGKYYYEWNRLDLKGYIEQDFIPVFLILVWVDLQNPNPERVLSIKMYINSIKLDTSIKHEMRDLNIEFKNKFLKLIERRENKKKIEIENEKKKVMSKIRQIMNVSNKFRLDILRDILKMEFSAFNESLLDWAVEFGFRIEGDFILIENADINAFISSLDKQFEMWGKNQKNSG